MNDETRKHQDQMVESVIELKTLQDRSPFKIALSLEGSPFIAVDEALFSVYQMTERKDLKKKISEILSIAKINNEN